MDHVEMKTLTLWVAPADIAMFKAIVESYDNLVTLRTQDPARSHLRMWFAAEHEADVRALLTALSEKLELAVIGAASDT